MKDGNEPKQSDTAKTPRQQQGEEFGRIKRRQIGEADHPERSDTPRGSEPETRGNSRRRG